MLQALHLQSGTVLAQPGLCLKHGPCSGMPGSTPAQGMMLHPIRFTTSSKHILPIPQLSPLAVSAVYCLAVLLQHLTVLPVATAAGGGSAPSSPAWHRSVPGSWGLQELQRSENWHLRNPGWGRTLLLHAGRREGRGCAARHGCGPVPLASLGWQRGSLHFSSLLKTWF